MKTEEFKTANDLRKLREDALIKAYEKAATEIYGRVFLPNWAEDKMNLRIAESLVDKMDECFEAEWRYIGEIYGLKETDESDD